MADTATLGRRGRRQENQAELAHLDLVTVDQRRRVDELAVDVGAINAADVNDLEVSVLLPKLCVAQTDRDVVEKDVAVAMATDRGNRSIQHEPGSGVRAALHYNQGRPRRRTRADQVRAAHVCGPMRPGRLVLPPNGFTSNSLRNKPSQQRFRKGALSGVVCRRQEPAVVGADGHAGVGS
jgi:hypothetical protein